MRNFCQWDSKVPSRINRIKGIGTLRFDCRLRIQWQIPNSNIGDLFILVLICVVVQVIDKWVTIFGWRFWKS
ncbi:hypothetical protein V6Z12_D10G165300 [Gossypium hirsutum]